jgi:hypothetical protein
MTEARRYVHIVDEVAELAPRPGGQGPAMLVALDGFLDAGNAASLAVGHLVGPDRGRVVASFDIDALYDYRARRPPMTFSENRYEGYEPPRLVVRLLRDRLGTPYLLLHGAEPDTLWEGYAAAVRAVVEHFDVRLTVTLGSVPMAVPHTRPVMLTNHATHPGLLVQENVWNGQIRIPASALALVEMRLGEWGHDAMGFVAHIPHYLAQLEYPAASIALLENLERAAWLTVDLSILHAEAAERDAEVARYLSANEEVAEVVAALERQYDAFERAESSGSSLLAQDQPLPTGEEIGQQFEQFLAGLDGPEPDQPGESGDTR